MAELKTRIFELERENAVLAQKRELQREESLIYEATSELSEQAISGLRDTMQQVAVRITEFTRGHGQFEERSQAQKEQDYKRTQAVVQGIRSVVAVTYVLMVLYVVFLYFS
eukprot:TRINITY_DN8944_c0_g1_i2.p2 TRINITY_DN8944_c0_g1~~TRINITY_DN8944_c0_g1_i2.p2  ORF type:complete len:111 (+),score=15.77 TRINITY_DN8944_c0_g1_i2:79-411(+)